MKTLLLIMIMSCGLGALAQQEQKKGGPETVKIKTSAVCDMCQETLEKAMAYEKGVKKSHLDVNSKILTVTYDPAKTSADKIRKAVSEAGYDADSIPANPRAYENLDPCCKKDAKH